MRGRQGKMEGEMTWWEEEVKGERSEKRGDEEEEV